MTDKEIIRKEIERWMGLCPEHGSVLGKLCDFIDSMQEEPTSDIDFEQELYKAFGQVKDFTLGMQIAKRFYEMGIQHQEPISEDLEKFANESSIDYRKMRDYQGLRDPIALNEVEDANYNGIMAGAKWQKEQMIKKAVTCGGDGWFINCKRNGRKNGKFHKYYQSTITHDKPLMMDGGTKYKLIIIKEE